MTAPPRQRRDGERTAIRPLGLGDLPEYLELVVANREHTAPWDPVRPEYFYTRSGQQDQLRRDEEAWIQGTGYAFAALDLAAGGRIVGRIALGNVVRGSWQNATLGYWIAADASGRGHGTEAVRLMLDFAFGSAGLHRIQPAIIPRNRASLRLAEKVGFRREGRALRYLQIAGVWEDHDIFSLTAEEWPVRRP